MAVVNRSWITSPMSIQLLGGSKPGKVSVDREFVDYILHNSIQSAAVREIGRSNQIHAAVF